MCKNNVLPTKLQTDWNPRCNETTGPNCTRDWKELSKRKEERGKRHYIGRFNTGGRMGPYGHWEIDKGQKRMEEHDQEETWTHTEMGRAEGPSLRVGRLKRKAVERLQERHQLNVYMKGAGENSETREDWQFIRKGCIKQQQRVWNIHVNSVARDWRQWRQK